MFSRSPIYLPTPEDRHLARKVNNALARLSLGVPTVQAEVRNGTVTLHGRVTSSDQKHLLQICISHIPGVRKLHDAMSLKDAESPSEPEGGEYTFWGFLDVPDRPGAPEFDSQPSPVLENSVESAASPKSARTTPLRAA